MDPWKAQIILALIDAGRPVIEMIVKWLLGLG
jgi:hypothetical protein